MTRARSLSQLANENVFTVDGGNNRIGIGSATPDAKLDIQGNIEVAGIITAAAGFAVTYFGDGSGLTGVASTDNIVTGTPATFNNQVTIQNLYVGAATTIQGTLSYEDVTNVDSLGIITARSHVSIADSILHTGDTDTSIRFPANDTFTVETAGGERLRIDSSGRLLQGKDTTKGSTGENVPTYCTEIADPFNPNVLEIANNGTGTNSYSALVLSRSDGTTVNSHTAVDSGDKIGEVIFIGADGADRFNNAASIAAFAEADFTANNCPGSLRFYTNPGSDTASERLRISSSGDVGVSTATPRARLCVSSGTSKYNPAASLGSGAIACIESNGTVGLQFLSGNTYNNYIYFGDTDSVTTGSIQYSHSANHLIFNVNGGAERLRIANNGEIGIGGANYGTAGQVLTSNGSGSAVSWEDASGGGGITTEAATPSNAVVQINLTDATDHKITATGICTITSTTAGTEGQSHTIRIVNSGIATVGFSTYFLFPSGSVPSLPTADGAVSIISFTVHDSVGAGCTQLLAGASLNFS